MKDETRQRLKTMGELLRTQDNAITAGPIFMVEKKVRDYGYDDSYTDLFTWVDEEGEASDDDQKRFESYYKKTGMSYRREYSRVGYKDRWEPVQPFFTRIGAEEYIAQNAHNLGESRIYVHGSYRNYEWQTVREYLLNVEEESEPVHYGIWTGIGWLHFGGPLFITTSKKAALAQLEHIRNRTSDFEVRPYGQDTTK